MRRGVFATKHAGGAISDALARGVAERELLGLEDEFERYSKPAAILSIAAGVRRILMLAEMQRETRFRHLDAAEFQPADRIPLADRRIAITIRRGPAARPRMEQMPDEAAAGL